MEKTKTCLRKSPKKKQKIRGQIIVSLIVQSFLEMARAEKAKKNRWRDSFLAKVHSCNFILCNF